MSARRIEAFLLRLVVEEDASRQPPTWRGRIQHVATGKEQKFEQLQDVVAFIAAHLDRIESNALDIEVQRANVTEVR